MKFVKTLNRNEMKNVMAGNGDFQGCYFECCSGGPGTCGPGTSVPIGSGGVGGECTSHEQCQSDYTDEMGNPCGEGEYIAALCYN